MQTIVDAIYWIKLVLLVVTVPLAVFAAVRVAGSRVFVPWRSVLQTAATVVMFVLIAIMAGVTFSPLWAVVLVVLGVAAGFFAERGGSRFERRGDTVCVRRSPLAPWVRAGAVILVVMTLLFGTSYLFGIGMLVLAFAMGADVGQVAAEFVGAKALARPEAAA